MRIVVVFIGFILLIILGCFIVSLLNKNDKDIEGADFITTLGVIFSFLFIIGGLFGTVISTVLCIQEFLG